MKLIKFKFFLIVFMICLGCHTTPTQVEQIELRSDFSESEFKEAIIGEWQSVYEIKGEENIKYLELGEQGKVKLILEKDSIGIEYEGHYSVDFLRPPSEGMVTLAELTISTSKGSIILSHVNFGLHNALPAESGPFLRIDNSPYGVLKKAI